jgi:F0F1-type ATP synthase membrane subunit c/vacuolar-type H+-ATPase subunit K
MKLIQVATALAAVAVLCGVGAALAQTPSMKTIGTPAAAAKPELVPSLFVLNSRGATLQGDTLTLTGVMPHSIIFADRPVRSAGHQLTADIIAEWGSGDDSFTKNPPNATISVFGKDGSVKDAVVVLKTPKLEGDKLTFNVQTLEGDIAGGDGGAALFIDIIGRPFTPMSFAGVGRRTAFRGAMYAGAAVGVAAVGAAAYAAPYAYAPPPVYPYPRPACGYYPYPPCY